MMRNKSALRVCLVVGVVLLVAQLSLLALLLYPHSPQLDFFQHDLEAISSITGKLQLSLIVVDSYILHHHLNQKQDRTEQCIFCDAKPPFTFAVLFRGMKHNENLLSMFEDAGFQAAVLQNTNPIQVAPSIVANIPISYLLKRKIVVHLVLLHEREGNFWWHGELSSDPKASTELSSVGITVHKLKLMKHEGAFEKFETERVTIDGIPFLVPKDIPSFLRDAANSRYLECNHERADSFHRKHGKDTTHEALRFTHRAWKILSRAKTLLDKLGVRFWLSSGTCLGYFRQCDIIPYSKDVDIGIFITDYNENIMTEFVTHGFTLQYSLGRVNDSLEFGFVSGGIKIDMFFFYEDGYWVWNGGTQAKTGNKFKYLFPRFTLCWTEFMELKVRVPCETQSYIEANYGLDWFTPVSEWNWKSSPPNVRENGKWKVEELPHVVRVYN